MKIAILGANGYIGHNLINKLLNETDHTIVALSLTAESIPITNSRLMKHNVDVFDTEHVIEYVKDCNMAYYLIHMMAQHSLDFAKAESLAAESFGNAVQLSSIKRVIFLGGLGNDHEKLSKHLASRHKTGEILRQYVPQLIEFRASMVIGDGSIAYDIIKNLIHKLPVMTLPKWAQTLTQPIGLEDALSYLVGALTVDTTVHEIVEIGGPEQLSYGDLMKSYATWSHKKMFAIKLHLIPVSVAALWLNLFTPKRHAKVGRTMVDSLSNPMIVTNTRAQELFPDIKPKKLIDVFV